MSFPHLELNLDRSEQVNSESRVRNPAAEGEWCSQRLSALGGLFVSCPFQEMAKEDPVCVPESMGSEDVLFMLYTSGSTGMPKGIVHTQAGYLLYAALTHKVQACAGRCWALGRAPGRGRARSPPAAERGL